MDVRKKYIGLQSKLKKSADEIVFFGDSSCFWLCLCSIAEEYNESHNNKYKVDILSDYIVCRSKGWIGKDFYIKDSPAILNYLTGATWVKNVKEKLPQIIPENMYTVEHWFNPATLLDHFKRRWGDTLDFSNTVKNGFLKEYYCFVYK